MYLVQLLHFEAMVEAGLQLGNPYQYMLEAFNGSDEACATACAGSVQTVAGKCALQLCETVYLFLRLAISKPLCGNMSSVSCYNP